MLVVSGCKAGKATFTSQQSRIGGWSGKENQLTRIWSEEIYKDENTAGTSEVIPYPPKSPTKDYPVTY